MIHELDAFDGTAEEKSAFVYGVEQHEVRDEQFIATLFLRFGKRPVHATAQERWVNEETHFEYCL